MSIADCDVVPQLRYIPIASIGVSRLDICVVRGRGKVYENSYVEAVGASILLENPPGFIYVFGVLDSCNEQEPVLACEPRLYHHLRPVLGLVTYIPDIGSLLRTYTATLLFFHH
jgi:hypothetical protein